MRSMKIILLTTFFLFGTITFAQENSMSLSLQEAIQLAEKNNIKLRDQSLDVNIAESQVDQTKAQGLPQVNASFDYQRTLLNAFANRTGGSPQIAPLDGNQFQQFNQDQLNEIQRASAQTTGSFFAGLGDAFASKHKADLGITLNQQLFNGVYLLGLKATEVYVDLAKIQSVTTKRDLEKDVEKAYYGALITHENIKLIDKNINNIKQLRHEVSEIYKAGFAEQLDIDRLDLSLSTLNVQRNSLLQIRDLNYKVLKNVINVPLSTKLNLTEPISLFEDEVRAENVISKLANPELWPEFQILDVQEKLKQLDINRIEKGKYPVVNAFVNGSYGYQGKKFIFNKGWYPNLVAGLNISLNVFDGHLRKNQLRQKRLEMEKIQLARESLQQNINIAVQSAQTQFANYRSELLTQQENVKLAEKIYNVTKIKYKAGVGSSIEMNQAEQSLFQAQQNYITALYNLLIAKVDLDKSLGK